MIKEASNKVYKSFKLNIEEYNNQKFIPNSKLEIKSNEDAAPYLEVGWKYLHKKSKLNPLTEKGRLIEYIP